MKFLHAADIHLGSGLPGFQHRSEGALPRDADVVRLAFRNLVDLARAEDVAFVVIAGDLYDGPWQDVSTGLFFAQEMARLDRPCILLRGNHDAASIVSRALPPPPGLRLFGTAACETVVLEELGVALHGQSFEDRAVREDLSAGYCAPVAGMLNIGVLHTSAAGDPAHDTYAPCTVEGLRARGYGYWALGHVHARRSLLEDPWIVFPGNIQGRHARETGPKGCTLVTVQDRQVVHAEHRDLDVLRWTAIEVDCADAPLVEVERRLEEGLAAAFAQAGPRAVAARIRLTGATALHGALADDAARLAEDAMAHAANRGRQLWLESLRVATRPLRQATDAHARLGERFRAALAGEATGMLEHLVKLRRELPAAAQEEAALPADAAGLATMVEEAWALVEARLVAEESA